MTPERAIVLLSGGQDSTTCLYWAKAQTDLEVVAALIVIYGQTHVSEVNAARQIAHDAQVLSYTVRLDALAALHSSTLTGGQGKYAQERGLPSSFTPGRNLAFFSLASAFAATLDASVIVFGGCLQDAEGYPDCRPDFLDAMVRAIGIGLDSPHFRIDAPLLALSKAQTWALADELGIVPTIIEDTVTCYEDGGSRHEWGRGCGQCPACIERAKGYVAWRESQ